ncbi:MAG: response regulator [Candidatus Odinarchaeia archaeon]
MDVTQNGYQKDSAAIIEYTQYAHECGACPLLKNMVKSAKVQNQYNVLLIDDDLNTLNLTKIFLEKLNNNLIIDSTTNASNILSSLDNYDCIVSDYQMPKMNGLELVKKIREVSNIPIILYSNEALENIVEAAFKAGIDDYVKKDCNVSIFTILEKRISCAIEKKRIKNVLSKMREELLNCPIKQTSSIKKG